MKTKQRLENSWNYLQSWKSKDAAYHGIIATYWDSSTDIVSPHVMNHFPVIEGLCLLHKRFGDQAFVDHAVEDGRFLVEAFNTKTGLFEHAWGDVPGKDTGVVHQSAAAGAMVELAAVTGEQQYTDIAVSTFRACRKRWPGILMNGVANQALKYTHGVMRLRELDKDLYSEFEKDINIFISELKQLVTIVDTNSVLLDQSAYSEMLMTVYEAKCLHGLFALYQHNIEKQWAGDLIVKIINGIEKKLSLGEGRYISHIDYQEIPLLDTSRILTAISRRILPPSAQISIEAWRKGIKKRYGPIVQSVGPVWLARIADYAFILNRVNAEFDLNRCDEVNDLNTLIDANQLPHGGVQNCCGPWTTDDFAWQKHICSTRWNAYVFRNYCLRTSVAPDFQRSTIARTSWGDDNIHIIETDSYVQFTNANNKVNWTKPG